MGTEIEEGTDADWEQFARDEPYWSVLSDDRFKQMNLEKDSEALDEFFDSGEQHVQHWFSQVERVLGIRDFAPRKGLDFGCGVGWLTLPLAQRCESVLGLDVSETMLGQREAASG